MTFEKRRASNLKERTVRNATFRNVSPVDENHEYSKDLMSLAKSTFITEKFGNFKNVISMVDNVQNLYEKYDKKVNFITSVIQDMGSAPPKLILPIMTWKREDLKSREKEANRIAKEYKFGGTDPSSNIK